jgi:AcrR family transcriptional regulator
MFMSAPPAARRPRNAEATRAAILEAAKRRFAGEGYEQVGVRDIAADAGIDPALVNRYFGSKEGLLNEVVNSSARSPFFEGAFSEPDFGAELARLLMRLSGDRHKGQLSTLDLTIRSTSSPTAIAIIREDLERRFIRPLVARFGGGPDATARAYVCVAITMGLGVMRGLLGDEGPGLKVREDMIAHLAPIFNQLSKPGPPHAAGD